MAEIDCVVGHEFGGRVNVMLARFILERFDTDNLPLMLNSNISEALRKLKPKVQPALIFSGESSNLVGRGEGTIGELRQAKDFMLEHGFKKSAHVAQAFHAGRVVAQAELIGLDPTIPVGLPRQFDWKSGQIWTKSWPLWALHEAVGIPVLRRRGEI